MSEHFKQVDNRTLADINKANHDAWGEKEINAVENLARNQPHGPLTKAQTAHAEEVSERHETLKGRPLGEFTKRRVAISQHPENDSSPQERTFRKLSNPTKYPNTGSHGHSPEQVQQRVGGEERAEAIVGQRIRKSGLTRGQANKALRLGEKRNDLIGS